MDNYQEFVSKRVIQGVEPVQPRFILPRKGLSGLTEPEQALVDQIRKVAEARSKREATEERIEAEVVVEALLE
jgi:hypothetical protein